QPAPGQPYFSFAEQVPDPPGVGTVEVEVGMTTGIVVRGRVTHAGTGQPVANAWVHYEPLYPNPYLLKLKPSPSGISPCSGALTAAAAPYAGGVRPGPGVVGAGTHAPRGPFLSALVTRRDLKELFGDDGDHGNEQTLRTQALGGWSGIGQSHYNHLHLINPP